MNDKIKAVKFVSRTTARIGTGIILKSALENNVNVDTKIQKIAVCVAAFVIAGLAKDAVGAATDAKVDEFVELYQSIESKLKGTQTEEPEAQSTE